jgi:alkylated DNA repair protein (DNA oxidative demethylase)
MDLLDHLPKDKTRQLICPGAYLLPGFALPQEHLLLSTIENITKKAPLRHMVTPYGYTMSVAMTNCGTVGWVTDKTGYRYDPIDPTTNLSWPAMPNVFQELAQEAAAYAGFNRFIPNGCLINRYEPGTKLSLHQDKDEHDISQPVVSVSLGIPATFLFGGLKRTDKAERIRLVHGDVVVWGGPARLNYHGILPLKPNDHPALGHYRFNLTFRKVAKNCFQIIFVLFLTFFRCRLG